LSHFGPMRPKKKRTKSTAVTKAKMMLGVFILK
jgi:hypothetical protein